MYYLLSVWNLTGWHETVVLRPNWTLISDPNEGGD